ncbi:hypothetical protein [Devosia lucknowensis]|uniref:hypothetical protein n=1 Tax=Devosia lucknowensis TaxID=1096929 RepID=UPI00112273A9|nr:hypothetical protein [Devosia lucknowensis]
MLPLLFLCACAAPVPVLASEAQCFQSKNHLVVFHDRIDEVGSDFIVRPPARGKIACVFDPTPDDRRIGAPGDPLHFLTLLGDYLILTRSTGPDGDLVIYDLSGASDEPVIDVPADDDVVVTEELTYWERTSDATSENCPQYEAYTSDGLGSVIAEERVFDPATGDVTETGNARCSATQ